MWAGLVSHQLREVVLPGLYDLECREREGREDNQWVWSEGDLVVERGCDVWLTFSEEDSCHVEIASSSLWRVCAMGNTALVHLSPELTGESEGGQETYILCKVASSLRQSASGTGQLPEAAMERGKEGGRGGRGLQLQPLDLGEVLFCL